MGHSHFEVNEKFGIEPSTELGPINGGPITLLNEKFGIEHYLRHRVSALII